MLFWHFRAFVPQLAPKTTAACGDRSCPLRPQTARRLGAANLISGVSNNHRRVCLVRYAVNPRHNRNPLFGLPRVGAPTLGNPLAMQEQKHIVAVLLGCD